MTLSRLTLCLVLACASLSGAAAAGDRGLAGGVVVSRPGLPLDPELLPPNTGPGDCVTRRVTGPGGAYRWDRVECEPAGGGEPWGYRRLDVQAPRYGDGLYATDNRHGDASYGDAPYGRAPYDDDRRPAHPYDRYGGGPVAVDYRYAGRDADGYLVWPGKTP